MSRLLKNSTSFLVLLVFGVFPMLFVSAQGIPGVGTPITVTADPVNPKPLETVTITLQSFSVNVNQANITWYSDGKVIRRGNGLKTITVEAGALGSSKTIEAVVSTKDAGDVSGSVTIRPANLALVWQAASYVPPFYKGKALLPFGGVYRVVALPEIVDRNGKKVNPGALVYSWKKNDALQQSASGYGKDSFVSSQTSFVRQGDQISVEVASPADGFSVSGNITVAPIAPEIHLYEDSPLYGVISERELVQNTTLKNEEIAIDSEPFFFSVKNKQNALLSYSWTLGGAAVQDFTNKPSVILRRADGSAGSSELGVTVGNSAKLLQGARTSLILRYEQNN